MDIKTLQKANEINRDLQIWTNVQTRLSCGEDFYQIRFVADKNKTMNIEHDFVIKDKKTIAQFTAFVEEKLKSLRKEFDSL